MKEHLLQLAQYNVWANKQFIDILRTLSTETLEREMVSSFPSLHKTVLHMWGAEDIWLQRLQQHASPVWKPAVFTGNATELMDNWESASAGFVKYLQGVREESELSKPLTIINLKGESHEDAISAILTHVFNHATYHRGQLVTMLRQSGVTEIPQTDFIVFARMKM